MELSLFLTAAEVAELTGIKRGHDGRTRGQLQCEHLRKNGIPFFQNASGEPKITRSYIEGRGSEQVNKPAPRWEPSVLQKAA